jgi:hypothetical protein
VSELGQFEFSFVHSYGRVWEEELARMWDDQAISLRRLAAALGTK